MSETIKNYATGDLGASASLCALEMFIGDMDNAELADDSTVDTSDAVTGINGLVFALEKRDAEIARLTKLNGMMLKHEGDAEVICNSYATENQQFSDEIARLTAENERLRFNRREAVAAWMMARGYATGHGDTIEDLLVELEGHAKDRAINEQELTADQVAYLRERAEERRKLWVKHAHEQSTKQEG